MNEQDIEQALCRFKLKEPTAATRQRVLAAAHQAWAQPRGVRVNFQGVGFRWVIGYACAAALLILLNGIYSTWDAMQMAELLTPPAAEQSMDPEMKEVYAELGRNSEIMRLFAALTRPAVDEKMLKESLKQRKESMRDLDLDV